MNTTFTSRARGQLSITCCLLLALAGAPAAQAALSHPLAPPAPPGSSDKPRAPLAALLVEALQHNPEIRAAGQEHEAASQRIEPAGALDDPMLEAGVLNLPTRSLSFTPEDMTMKMLGLSQRFPYPGKRALRRDVAQKGADSVSLAARETTNRVARELKIAYYDLALVIESQSVVEQNRALLGQLLKVAESRYTVGQGSQLDVLKAQTAYSRMSEELIRLAREKPMLEAELNRLLGRPASAPAPVPVPLEVSAAALSFPKLEEQAATGRPQLLALQALTIRNQHALELAAKDRFPDFDVRFSYGQRDRMPDGTPRSDVVTLTVAINLPVWRQAKTNPRIAEAQALYEQSLSTYEMQRNETAMKLRQQVAVAEQSLRAAALYRNELVPQSRLAVDAASSAYQVNRLDFSPLLDSRMSVLNFEISRAAAIASYNKALAEIDFLTGTPPESSTQTRGHP